MDNPQTVEENIETFYERNNLNIPEVEKQHYFKDNIGPELNVNDPTVAKVAKQYQLYKGFLASEKIKESTGMRAHQVIPDDSDPRNLRFYRSRIPMCEQDNKRRNDHSAPHRDNEIDEPPVEIFTKHDVRRSGIDHDIQMEKARLLEGYDKPDKLAYPEIINFDENQEDAPYEPIEDAKDEPIIEPVIEPASTAQEATNRPPPSQENFVIHVVKPNDTIERLCLQYNVNKDVIRMANDFMGEEIYMFKTLKIPYTYGKMYESVHNEEADEESKKRFAVDTLNRILQESYKKQADYAKEAKYYLEMNNYILDKAISEFEADMEFEKQVVKENRAYKQRKRRKERIGVFGCL